MFFQERADLDRLEIACADTTLIKGAEEGHAAAGIMLPAVLAVENDTDQSRLSTGDRLADAPQVLYEVVGGRDRITPLVMETDHIAQGVIAEDDGQLVTPFADLVRPVHLVGVAHVAAVIAADKAVSGCTEDLVIGGGPADAVLGQYGK